MSEYEIDYCHHDSLTAQNTYIKREDAFKAVEKCKEDTQQQLSGMKCYLNAIPAADVVPIGEEYECGYTDGQMAERKALVHCKECEHAYPVVEGRLFKCYMHCDYDGYDWHYFHADDYCSYGDRKEREHD